MKDGLISFYEVEQTISNAALLDSDLTKNLKVTRAICNVGSLFQTPTYRPWYNLT